jgi:hypothetical protein
VPSGRSGRILGSPEPKRFAHVQPLGRPEVQRSSCSPFPIQAVWPCAHDADWRVTDGQKQVPDFVRDGVGRHRGRGNAEVV